MSVLQVSSPHFMINSTQGMSYAKKQISLSPDPLPYKKQEPNQQNTDALQMRKVESDTVLLGRQPALVFS